MRLIDADKIINDLEAMRTQFDAIALDGLIRGIEEQPTIEAEPVRLARWKNSDFIPGMLTCTNCGAQRNPKFKIGGGEWNYCPNCGKMMYEMEGASHDRP